VVNVARLFKAGKGVPPDRRVASATVEPAAKHNSTVADATKPHDALSPVP